MSKKKKQRPSPATLGLPLTGVDSHAHLDLGDLSQDLDGVLSRCKAAGVASIGQVFLGPDAYHAGKAKFAGYSEVFFILGVHPNEAQTCTDAALAAMQAAFEDDARLKALGEIGLDFYWDKVPPEVQERAFRAQLELARQLDTPPVIHCREAFAATLPVLDDMGFKDRPLLWHCFGGDAAMARELLARGWTISLPGPLTYRKNEDLRVAAVEIPLERLVVETDCPYLSPEPWRGKPNEPAHAAFTGAELASLKGLDPAEVWTTLGNNARTFFGV